MNARDKAFYSGIRTALCLLDLYGQDTIYDELVAQCNVEELVASAIDDDEIEWSGLARHGYAQQSFAADGLPTPPKVTISKSGEMLAKKHV